MQRVPPLPLLFAVRYPSGRGVPYREGSANEYLPVTAMPMPGSRGPAYLLQTTEVHRLIVMVQAAGSKQTCPQHGTTVFVICA